MRLPNLPEEIIDVILSYAPDFHTNLLKCHAELLEDRPCYYKRVHAGFKPGISDSSTWHNFPKRNHIINVQFQTFNGEPYTFPLKLHAIEITPERPPNDRYWHSRDMNLYYGWGKMTDRDFWNTVTKANLLHDTFSPGYY